MLSPLLSLLGVRLQAVYWQSWGLQAVCQFHEKRARKGGKMKHDPNDDLFTICQTKTTPVYYRTSCCGQCEPLWDARWCKGFPGCSSKELGHRRWWTCTEWVCLLNSALKSQDLSKAHFLSCYTPSSGQSLFLGAHNSSSVLDVNQSWV